MARLRFLLIGLLVVGLAAGLLLWPRLSPGEETVLAQAPPSPLPTPEPVPTATATPTPTPVPGRLTVACNAPLQVEIDGRDEWGWDCDPALLDRKTVRLPPGAHRLEARPFDPAFPPLSFEFELASGEVQTRTLVLPGQVELWVKGGRALVVVGEQEVLAEEGRSPLLLRWPPLEGSKVVSVEVFALPGYEVRGAPGSVAIVPGRTVRVEVELGPAPTPTPLPEEAQIREVIWAYHKVVRPRLSKGWDEVSEELVRRYTTGERLKEILYAYTVYYPNNGRWPYFHEPIYFVEEPKIRVEGDRATAEYVIHNPLRVEKDGEVVYDNEAGIGRFASKDANTHYVVGLKKEEGHWKIAQLDVIRPTPTPVPTAAGGYQPLWMPSKVYTPEEIQDRVVTIVNCVRAEIGLPPAQPVREMNELARRVAEYRKQGWSAEQIEKEYLFSAARQLNPFDGRFRYYISHTEGHPQSASVLWYYFEEEDPCKTAYAQGLRRLASRGRRVAEFEFSRVYRGFYQEGDRVWMVTFFPILSDQ